MEQNSLFRQAAEEVSAEFSGRQATSDAEELARVEGEDAGVVDRTIRSIAAGGAKAVFETKDFIVGEPSADEKSGFRKSVEAQSRALSNESVGYGLAGGISQFAVGLVGAGKLMAPIRGLQAAGKAGRAGFEVIRGAVAGSIVLDPHEARLSDIVQSFPALENPVAEYLASDPSDSNAEGRFKNALEGIGMDVALIGTFALGMKALRLAKARDTEGAQATLKELEAAQKANHEAFGLPGTDAPRMTPEEALAADPAAQAARQANEEAFGMPTGREGEPQISPTQAAAEARARTANEEAFGLPTEMAPSSPQSAVPGTQPLRTLPDGSTELPAIEITQTTTRKGGPKSAKTNGVEGAPELPLPALNDIAETTYSDISALTRFGTREAAQQGGHKFATEAALPWQKLQTTEAVRSYVDATVKEAEGFFNAKKGGEVLSDARVNKLVSQMAEVFNADPAMLAGVLSAAGDNARSMVAKMETSFLVGQKMFQDAYTVQTRIENGMLGEWGGDIGAAREELRKRLIAALDVTASGNSILANSGRSLRRARSQFQIKQSDIDAIASLDGDKLSAIVSGTKGDPKKLVKVADPKLGDKIFDTATGLLANNLLWLYPTHLVNISTNLFMLAARPTEKLIGSYAVRGASGSAVRRQALKEYNYVLASLGDSWEAAVAAFMRGDSSLKPHGDEFMEVQGGMAPRDIRAGWRPANSILDIAANGMKAGGIAIGLPTRALGGVDELIKQMRYRAVVQANAAVEAQDMGLVGDAFRQHVQRKLDDSFDEAGRGNNPAALREAQTVTFQDELNQESWIGNQTTGAWVRNARTNLKWPGLILPFVKTPVNVLRYGIKLTPGLNMLQKEFNYALRGKSGPEAQAHAVGQFAMGSIFMGLAATLASSGKITGSGPTNPTLRKEMMAQGWKPYSYVSENEDGSKTYTPMGRFDPPGLVFGMVADLMDIMVLHPNTREAEKGITAVAVAMAQNLGDKAFLLNLNQALRAITEPDANMAKFSGNLASNMVPGASAIRGYVNQDPYLRDARGFVDNMLKNLPGYSETLPPQRDVYGDPVWRRIALTSTSEPDIVEEEHERIVMETGFGIGAIAPTRNGVDLRDLQLEDGSNAYDRLQQYAGDGLKPNLAKLIQSDGYQQLVDGDASTKGTKLYALSGVVSKYREAAFKRLKAESPLLRQALMQRQIDARGALLTKREETRKGQPGVRDLLADLGFGN